MLPKTKNTYLEKVVKFELCGQTYGVTEAAIPFVGFADLITRERIIELKYFKEWKEAVGQILVYSHYYPQHTPTIYLFSRFEDEYFTNAFLNTIKMHCDSLGIELMLDDKVNIVTDDYSTEPKISFPSYCFLNRHTKEEFKGTLQELAQMNKQPRSRFTRLLKGISVLGWEILGAG
jgi:hypothetical protein